MKTKFTSALFLGLVGLLSCEYNDIDLNTRNSYFPITDGSWWMYEVRSSCNWPNESQICVETALSTAGGEDLAWDESFERYSSAVDPFQFVKKIDGEYFGFGHYLPQYKFLDDNLPKGGRWMNGDPSDTRYVEEYEILENNATKEVLGVTFQDVIVVRSTTLWSGRVVTIAEKAFARGVGEIYSIVTNFAENGTRQIWEYRLKEYSVK